MDGLEGVPLEPLSDEYGFDRGTPIDRHFIESFLAEHRDSVAGAVLEVGDDRYTAQFGDDRITSSAIVDLDDSNPQTTLFADLVEVGSLPSSSYDCIILTQTLHLLADPGRSLANCYQALRMGGSLLVTAPTLSRISPSFPESDRWRFTPAGLRQLFAERWRGEFSILGFGNLRTCIGFLAGEVVEELAEPVLAHHDPRFPVTVAARAVKA